MRYIGYMTFAVGLLLSSCAAEEEPIIMDTPSDPDPEPTMFEAAPDFSIQTTTDQTLTLSQFDDKVLVIFFFGADCPPCLRVGPDVESMLHQEFIGNENFAMIGADQWNLNDAAVDGFVASTGITFDVGRMGASMASDFGTTFDRMVVLNRESEIVYRSPSRVSGRLPEVIDIVKDLLEG